MGALLYHPQSWYLDISPLALFSGVFVFTLGTSILEEDWPLEKFLGLASGKHTNNELERSTMLFSWVNPLFLMTGPWLQ
jgi:hypothetical protein